MVMSAAAGGPAANDRLIRSTDRTRVIWLGVSDDLWRLGKVRGEGGPWKDADVKAGGVSDPYLMTGFDDKIMRLSHGGKSPLPVRVEVDLTGMGLWVHYATFEVPAGRVFEHRFREGFNAYWLRAVALADARVSADLTYR